MKTKKITYKEYLSGAKVKPMKPLADYIKERVNLEAEVMYASDTSQNYIPPQVIEKKKIPWNVGLWNFINYNVEQLRP